MKGNILFSSSLERKLQQMHSHDKIKRFRMIFKEANLELERYLSSLALVLEDELLSYYCGFMNKEILY